MKKVINNVCVQLTDFSGVDFRKKMRSKRHFKQFQRTIETIIELNRDIDDIKKKPESREKMIETLNWIILSFRRLIKIPKDEGAITFLKNAHKENIKASEHPFLRTPNRKFYLAKTREIFKKMKPEDIVEFKNFILNYWGKDKKVLSMIQYLFTREFQDLEHFIGLDGRKIDFDLVDDTVNIYKEMADVYEKMIKLVLFFQKREKNQADYKKIMQIEPRDVLFQLRNDEKYSVFLSDYNKPIRNAIAHGNIQKSMISKKIRFVDQKQEIELSPSRLFMETRKFLALNVILMSFFPRAYLKEIEYIEQTIKQNMKKYKIRESDLKRRMF